MKKIAFLAALPIVAIAAPAAAQMKPAGAADVVAAIEVCKSVTTPDWIHLDRLESQNWHTAEIRGERRRTRKVRGIYETPGNRAFVVITREELRNKECVVQARLKDTASYPALLQEVSQSVGMPNGQDGFAYTWDLGDFTMRVEPTGERSAPNARFTLKAKGDGAVSGSAIPMVGSDDVLAAVRACVPSIGPAGFADSALISGGWKKGVAKVDGKAIDAPVALYGHSDTKALIMSGSAQAANKVCVVMGRVEDAETIENTRSALTGMFGTPQADGDKLYWTEDDRILTLMTDYQDGEEGPFAIQVPISYVGAPE